MMRERVVVRPGPSSSGGRTLVIWIRADRTQDQLAEVDECYGNARGVNVNLMGDLLADHPGWRYKRSLEDGVAYVIRMHQRHGRLPADVPIEWY